MIKNILSLLTLTFSIIATSQITVTPTDFASPADTVMISSSDELNLDISTTGANSYWDFSTINISAQRIDTFYSVADAEVSYQIIFNNSWDNPDHVSDYYTPWRSIDFSQASQLGIDVQNPVQFTDVDTNKVENTGIGMYVNGFAIPAKSDTIDNQYMLPMNYGDSWTSNSYLNVDLNPAFNGIFRRYQQRNSVVDGWGQIATPFKTYEVIRVKSLLSFQDSVYVDLGFGGNWFEMPTPDQVEYDWIAKNEKTPVFSVVTQDVNGTETITTIEFKDKKRYFASADELPKESALVYPNPANETLNIQLLSNADKIKIHDLSGRLVMEKKVAQTNQMKLDVSEFQEGHYVYSIYKGQELNTRGKFAVIH